MRQFFIKKQQNDTIVHIVYNKALLYKCVILYYLSLIFMTVCNFTMNIFVSRTLVFYFLY